MKVSNHQSHEVLEQPPTGAVGAKCCNPFHEEAGMVYEGDYVNWVSVTAGGWAHGLRCFPSSPMENKGWESEGSGTRVRAFHNAIAQGFYHIAHHQAFGQWS